MFFKNIMQANFGAPNRPFLWQLNDIVVRIKPNLVSLFETIRNTPVNLSDTS